MIKALAMSWLLALAACGGGGRGGAASVPAASAEGLWNGSTSTSRSVTAIVLDDGSYWVLYSVPRVSAVIAGFVQGSGSSLNGSFSSSDGIDFNLEGQGINNATVAANYVARQSFNGSVSYPNLNPPFTFTSAYNADYDQTPSLSAIAGSYAGIASVAGGTEATTITISPQGVVAGTGLTASACQFLGAVVPRAKGNLYDLSVVASGGGACASGTSAVTGIAYFDSGSKRLHLAALNKSRSNGLSFVGIKP
jgi:hypothetical protein